MLTDLIKCSEAHGGGRLDILVNNAGSSSVDTPIETFDDTLWQKQLALNLTAPFNAIRYALPGMRSHRWGRIVNVASVLGLVGVANRAGYVASKHALVGLTKVVALETADSPVTCNAICPGLVGTERVLEKHRQQAADTDRGVDDVKRQAMSARQPSGQYIRAVDVAAAIAYLCGPFAQEVRGAIWTIDGGWCAR